MSSSTSFVVPIVRLPREWGHMPMRFAMDLEYRIVVAGCTSLSCISVGLLILLLAGVSSARVGCSLSNTMPMYCDNQFIERNLTFHE